MKSFRTGPAVLLIPTLCLVGVFLPLHAAGEESPLTINGLLLSHAVNNRGAFGDPIPLAGLLGQQSGQISGVAVDGAGQPLADHTVRLTRVVMVGDSRGVQRGGAATTGADGTFAFSGLRASDYVVEVMSGDDVLADAAASLTEGAMQVEGIRVALPAEVPSGERNWWQRRSTAAKVGIIVGAFLGAAAAAALICPECGQR